MVFSQNELSSYKYKYISGGTAETRTHSVKWEVTISA